MFSVPLLGRSDAVMEVPSQDDGRNLPSQENARQLLSVDDDAVSIDDDDDDDLIEATPSKASASVQTPRPPPIDEDSAVQCLICLSALIDRPVCTLRCGHVYHGDCMHDWLTKSKGNGSCPQCKQMSRAAQLRVLDFKTAEVPTQSVEQLYRLESFTASQRDDFVAEMAEGCNLAEKELAETEMLLAEMHDSATDKLQSRRNVRDEIKEGELRILDLREVHEERSTECTQCQSELDAMNMSQQRRLPIQIIKDSDPDLLDMRRVLKSVRPGDRAKQLHQRLVKTRQLADDTRQLVAERKKAVAEAEQELKRQRQKDSKLRRQLSDRQENVFEQTRSSASLGSQAGRSLLALEVRDTVKTERASEASQAARSDGLRTGTERSSAASSSLRRGLEGVKRAVGGEDSAATGNKVRKSQSSQSSSFGRDADNQNNFLTATAGASRKSLFGPCTSAVNREDEDAVLYGGARSKRPVSTPFMSAMGRATALQPQAASGGVGFMGVRRDNGQRSVFAISR